MPSLSLLFFPFSLPKKKIKKRREEKRKRGEERRGREGELTMVVTLVVWLSTFFLLIADLSLVVYQLMCLADLEYDYINPYDSASRINSVVIPEFALQGALCLLFLLSGHWVMFLLCLPNLYWNFMQYQQRRHLVDVTEIFNTLNREKKTRMLKIANIFVLLFLSLFWLIWYLMED